MNRITNPIIFERIADLVLDFSKNPTTDERLVHARVIALELSLIRGVKTTITDTDLCIDMGVRGPPPMDHLAFGIKLDILGKHPTPGDTFIELRNKRNTA
jgi:hypothetical protein